MANDDDHKKRDFACKCTEHRCERINQSLVISDMTPVSGVDGDLCSVCDIRTLALERVCVCLSECTRVYLHSVILLVRGQQKWGDCQQWKSIKTCCWQSVSKHCDLLRISQQTLQERIQSEWEGLKNPWRSSALTPGQTHRSQQDAAGLQMWLLWLIPEQFYHWIIK